MISRKNKQNTFDQWNATFECFGPFGETNPINNVVFLLRLRITHLYLKLVHVQFEKSPNLKNFRVHRKNWTIRSSDQDNAELICFRIKIILFTPKTQQTNHLFCPCLPSISHRARVEYQKVNHTQNKTTTKRN